MHKTFRINVTTSKTFKYVWFFIVFNCATAILWASAKFLPLHVHSQPNPSLQLGNLGNLIHVNLCQKVQCLIKRLKLVKLLNTPDYFVFDRATAILWVSAKFLPLHIHCQLNPSFQLGNLGNLIHVNLCQKVQSPVSGFRCPMSGFRCPVSGFRCPVSGFRGPHKGLNWRILEIE